MTYRFDSVPRTRHFGKIHTPAKLPASTEAPRAPLDDHSPSEVYGGADALNAVSRVDMDAWMKRVADGWAKDVLT